MTTRNPASFVVHAYEKYSYEPWEDREPDNIKIWHEIHTPDGETISGPWGPYHHPSFKEFKNYIDGVLEDKQELEGIV